MDDGNTTEETLFDYDARDHLTQITRGPPGAGQVLGQFDYDADGMRVRVRDPAGLDRGNVDYFYDDSAVLEERRPDDTLLARYHYAASGALALDDYSGASGGARSYYHHDALGTPTHLSASVDGSMVASYRVDPWGRPRAGVDPQANHNRKLFTGHEYDASSGLYYAKARYYDPDLARFISADSYLGSPGAPPSLHRYMYANANPGRYVDPSGNFYVDENGGPLDDPTASPGYDPSSEEHRNQHEEDGTAWVCRADNTSRQCLIYERWEAGKEVFTTGEDKTGRHPSAPKRTVTDEISPSVPEPEILEPSPPLDSHGDPVLKKREREAIYTHGVVDEVIDNAQWWANFSVPYWMKDPGQVFRPFEEHRAPPEATKRAQQLRERSQGAFAGALLAASLGWGGGGGAKALSTQVVNQLRFMKASLSSSLSRLGSNVSSRLRNLMTKVEVPSSKVGVLDDLVCPCFTADTKVTLGDGSNKAIAEISLGQRVLPEVESCHQSYGELQIVSLEARNVDGQLGSVELLRSVEWVEANALMIGARALIDLPEVGISGWATVKGITRGPPVEDGPGCPVTAVFKHDASDVLLIGLETGEVIEVTSRHLIQSAERGWIAAESLRVGEDVETLKGVTRVQSSTRKESESEPVYNFEVDGAHQYYVGEAEVLVHNQCTCMPPGGARGGVQYGPVTPQANRLQAYKAWKRRSGLAGQRPTQARFRDFVRGNTGKNGGGFYEPRSGYGKWFKMAGKRHGHHAFPQEFADDFARIGIDRIDDYVFDIPAAHHLRTVHGGANGGRYNQFWQEFFEGAHGPVSAPNAHRLMDGLRRNNFVVK